MVSLGSLVSLFTIIGSKSVNAGTITFSNIVNPTPGTNGSFPILEVENFIFESQGAFDFVSLVFEPDNCFDACVPGELPYLATGGSSTTTSMRLSNNRLFSLDSIDSSQLLVIERYNSPVLVVTGLRSDNSLVSTSFNLDIGFDLFLLPETFTNLQKVTFSGIRGPGILDDNLAIDNIVFSIEEASIPEPTPTPAFFALSTLGAGLALKRRLKPCRKERNNQQTL